MNAAQLIIGNRNTSRWSMATWLATRRTDLEIEEIVVDRRAKGAHFDIGRYSPSGELPVLVASEIKIWDPIAIIEFLAEVAPVIWPADPWQRAQARSICCELRYGFHSFKHFLPMDCAASYEPPGRLLMAVERDIDRMSAIIAGHRPRHVANGDYLFGEFSAADMLLAPFVCCFATYQVPLNGLVEDYCRAVYGHQDVQAWLAAANAEVNPNGTPRNNDEQAFQTVDGGSVADQQPEMLDYSGGAAEAPVVELNLAAETEYVDHQSAGDVADEPPNDRLGGGERPAIYPDSDEITRATARKPKNVGPNQPPVKPIGGGIHRRR